MRITHPGAARRLFVHVLATLAVLCLARTALAQDQPASTVSKKKLDHDDSWTMLNLYTRLDIAATSLDGSSRTATDGVVGFAGTFTTRTDTLVHGIYESDFALGGGEADVTGVARAYGWVGMTPTRRGSVRPFARVGAGFDFRGNDAYLHSHGDLGATQLGFRLLRDDWLVDVGAHAAYVATGRYDVDGLERKLDGKLAWGGFVEARSALPFMGRMEFRQYGTTETAVRSWTYSACVGIDAAFLTLCLDGMTASGPIANGGQVSESWAMYTGASIGVGKLGLVRDL